MAQVVRTVVDLIDDINGKPAVETVNWSLDGEDLVMDLTAANAAKFRRRVEEFRAASRKVVKTRSKAPAEVMEAANLPPASSPATAADIRAWAKANGYEVADKGYIPAHIRKAFNHRND